MYWSGVQSTGAEMRKYFTASMSVNGSLLRYGEEAWHTVVNLLQRDDGVLRQALLRILIQQEGLGCDRALLLWRWHCRMLVVGIHIVDSQG